MSGKLENLRRLLTQGHTPRDLVAQGYPKTSVYKAAHQLRRRSSLRASGIGAQAEGVFVKDRSYILEVEPSSRIEPPAEAQLKVKLDEVIRRIEQEYERLRIERKAREAATIAEERARREREQKELNARRRRFFEKALEAHKAGKIENYQLVVLTSGLDTLEDIESAENALRQLVTDTSIRLQREARQAAIAEEQAKREQARREQVQKVENAGARLFKNAIAVHKAGKIDFHQLLVLTRGRRTLEDIERGKKVLKLLAGNPFTD